MENKTSAAEYFDKTLTTGQIQQLKTAIPYVDASAQKLLAIYVKFQELEYTVSFFQDHSLKPPAGKKDSPFSGMLNEMKAFCDEEQKKNIDGMLNMLSAFEMYQKYQDLFKGLDLSAILSKDGMPDLSAFLSKENTPDLSAFLSKENMPDLSDFLSKNGAGLYSFFSKEGEEAPKASPPSSPPEEPSEPGQPPSDPSGMELLRDMMSPEQLKLYEEFLNSP